jgi:hypothetical protein
MITVAHVQAQTRSHEDCVKQVPEDWGPNFSEVWHQHEAAYWGCRLGVSAATVAAWQGASHEQEMAQNILRAVISGQELVIMQEVGGDAHCSTVKVLKRVASGWTQAWELPIPHNSMKYCTFACPGLKLSLTGNILTISSPTANENADITRSCKRFSWRKETFSWNGNSFDRLGKANADR